MFSYDSIYPLEKSAHGVIRRGRASRTDSRRLEISHMHPRVTPFSFFDPLLSLSDTVGTPRRNPLDSYSFLSLRGEISSFPPFLFPF